MTFLAQKHDILSQKSHDIYVSFAYVMTSKCRQLCQDVGGVYKISISSLNHILEQKYTWKFRHSNLCNGAKIWADVT